MSHQANSKTLISTLEQMLLMSGCGAGGLDQGTAAHDFLLATNPHQVLEGLDGYDVLVGVGGDNELNGGDGHDRIFVIRGINHVDGGDGTDTAVLWQAARADAQVFRLADGRIRIETPNATNYLQRIEKVAFSDGEYSVDELITPTREYRSIDGTNNNLLNPELGSTDERLIRMSEVEYADGVGSPAGGDRPGARTISNEILARDTSAPNDRGLTNITWLWGQFLDHDISISPAHEPHESFDISVPAGDALFDPTYTGDVEIEFNRTVFATDSGLSDADPREQMNEITAWVDGSNVYGSDPVRAAALRSFDSGRLLVTDDNLLIFNDAGLPNAADGVPPGTELFLAGDERANENVALASMHTLWAREHNRLADEIAAADSTLSDEQIYQQAREIVIAELQAVSYNEFLPAILGDDAILPYSGYDPSVDPSVANEFSAAAYRFGHTMLTSELQRLNNDRTEIVAGHVDLKDAFFAPSEVIEHGIDSVLLGATQQVANEVDAMLVNDVRSFLFGRPGNGGFDLGALNIQRGRDHGLADYNQARIDIGLPAVNEFSDITSDTELQVRLEELYGTVDEIDLWVGGLAEDHVDGASLGETFRTIIGDQFRRLRDGDRFWYENILDGDQLVEIQLTTLADVIERNTTIEGLQENVFFIHEA